MPIPSSFTLIILCGKTGAGKTPVLRELLRLGYPVIDLEKIAMHRGSAFGGLLLNEQPSQEHFENEIEKQILEYAYSKYIFIEQKSSSLGKRKIPVWLYTKMNEGIFAELNTGKNERIHNILTEYKPAGKDAFVNAVNKLNERLPVTVMEEMKTLLESGNYELFIEKMLDYYDHTSKYQLHKQPDIILNTKNTKAENIAAELIQKIKEISFIS